MPCFSAAYFFLENPIISLQSFFCACSSCFNNVLDVLFDCLKTIFLIVRLKSRRHNAKICQRLNTRLDAISATTICYIACAAVSWQWSVDNLITSFREDSFFDFVRRNVPGTFGGVIPFLSTTTEYSTTQNMYPISADTGYRSCIPSWILFIN